MNINPYAPEKILLHKKTWDEVHSWILGIGNLPAPITVSIDPSNRCQMSCLNCNAKKIIEDEKQDLSKEYLTELAISLGEWGVRGACLGGGGCALMNKNAIYLIEQLYNNKVKSGIVTNGLLANRLVESPISWVGVSVDAGTPDIWGKIHGMSPDLFQNVLHNLELLANNGIHTTYKYLIRPENVSDIYWAVEQAYKVGCKSFHIRPAAVPWFDKIHPIFDEIHLHTARNQLSTARQNFGDKIKIIGVFDKVGPQWEIQHPFDKCWAIFCSCVFLANYKIGLCCDNRGNKIVEVGPFDHPATFINEFWGSQKHKNIQSCIDISRCTRCTFACLNQFFEQGVIEDGFMEDFI